MTELFRQGGPHNNHKTGQDKYTLQIKMPSDEAGMSARECPRPECEPGRFKVKCGTGITDEHTTAYCPYCRTSASPSDFATAEQLSYAKDVAIDAVKDGLEQMLKSAFGIGSSGRRRFGNCIEMKYTPGHRRRPKPPYEEQLLRDVTCPHCTLEHAVYGLATWCSDCGHDIFAVHVDAEAGVVRSMLEDIDRRAKELGPRVVARTIENALEDVVSLLEASLKSLIRRRHAANGMTTTEIEDIIKKKVRNRCQGYDGAVDTLKEQFGFDLRTLVAAAKGDRLTDTLEKRHPITHNLGIVDSKYRDKADARAAQGRDVKLTRKEVRDALDTVVSLIKVTHAGLFP